jgi:hypothetical protein
MIVTNSTVSTKDVALLPGGFEESPPSSATRLSLAFGEDAEVSEPGFLQQRHSFEGEGGKCDFGS